MSFGDLSQMSNTILHIRKRILLTSPEPLHLGHRSSVEPGSARRPLQRLQTVSMATRMSLLAPNTASINDRFNM